MTLEEQLLALKDYSVSQIVLSNKHKSLKFTAYLTGTPLQKFEVTFPGRLGATFDIETFYSFEEALSFYNSLY